MENERVTKMEAWSIFQPQLHLALKYPCSFSLHTSSVVQLVLNFIDHERCCRSAYGCADISAKEKKQKTQENDRKEVKKIK
jgi:hypothetical protein